MITLYAIISAVLLFFIFYKFIFLRDPKVEIPSGRNIVSPADGKIVNIMEIKSSEIKIKKGFIGKIHALSSDIGDRCYLISIFMSLFNVHINRAPIEGEVLSVKHTKGSFFMAFDIEKSLCNEKNEIIMKTKIGKIKIIQIAGFLVRRIECFVKENQKVNKGNKIGRIVFGSQVSLIIPAASKLKVKQGDRVKVGETILVEY